MPDSIYEAMLLIIPLVAFGYITLLSALRKKKGKFKRFIGVVVGMASTGYCGWWIYRQTRSINEIIDWVRQTLSQGTAGLVNGLTVIAIVLSWIIGLMMLVVINQSQSVKTGKAAGPGMPPGMPGMGKPTSGSGGGLLGRFRRSGPKPAKDKDKGGPKGPPSGFPGGLGGQVPKPGGMPGGGGLGTPTPGGPPKATSPMEGIDLGNLGGRH